MSELLMFSDRMKVSVARSRERYSVTNRIR